MAHGSGHKESARGSIQIRFLEPLVSAASSVATVDQSDSLSVLPSEAGVSFDEGSLVLRQHGNFSGKGFDQYNSQSKKLLVSMLRRGTIV